MPASLDSRTPRDRTGVMLGAGTADLLRNEEWFAETRTRGIRRAHAVEDLQSFSEHAGRRRRNLFRLRRIEVVSARRRVRRAPWRSAMPPTPSIGADRCRRWPGASDVLCRLTFSGFNALRLVDTEPCRPFCRTRQGMNHRRGRGDAGARRLDRRARGAAHRFTQRLPATASVAKRTIPPSPEPEGRAVAALIERALRAARLCCRRDRSRQRPRHGDAAKRPGRSARHPASVRRSRARTCP